MSNLTEWDNGDKSLAKNPIYAKHIWNVISAMYNVVTTIRPSSSGHWVMKPVWDLTSNIAIHGSKNEDKTRAVQYEQAGTSEFTDIFCPMYYDYNNCIKYCEGNIDKPPYPMRICTRYGQLA